VSQVCRGELEALHGSVTATDWLVLLSVFKRGTGSYGTGAYPQAHMTHTLGSPSAPAEPPTPKTPGVTSSVPCGERCILNTRMCLLNLSVVHAPAASYRAAATVDAVAAHRDSAKKAT
jgi:hypothetical protein